MKIYIFINIVLITFLFLSCKEQKSKGLNEISTNEINLKKPVEQKQEEYLYNKKINLDAVNYKKYETELDNIEDWYCAEESLRYLPVLKKDDVSLILVPQDCGDFKYRYYLLSLYNNSISSNLYVEGEWYEPGTSKDEYFELTSFIIDSNYQIKITKEIFEYNKITDSETTIYLISKAGRFTKL